MKGKEEAGKRHSSLVAVLPYSLAYKEVILFCILVLYCLVFFLSHLKKNSYLQPARYSFGLKLANNSGKGCMWNLSRCLLFLFSPWILLILYFWHVGFLLLKIKQNKTIQSIHSQLVSLHHQPSRAAQLLLQSAFASSFSLVPTRAGLVLAINNNEEDRYGICLCGTYSFFF